MFQTGVDKTNLNSAHSAPYSLCYMNKTLKELKLGCIYDIIDISELEKGNGKLYMLHGNLDIAMAHDYIYIRFS